MAKLELYRPPYAQLDIAYCLKWFGRSDDTREMFIDCDADSKTYSRETSISKEHGRD